MRIELCYSLNTISGRYHLSNSLSNLVTAVAQFIGCLIMSHSQKYFTARQESLGNLNGYIEEMYTGHDVIRILNAGDEVRDTFDSLNQEERILRGAVQQSI